MEHLMVKLCGLRTEADVAAVNAALPDFAGFVIEVPGKRRSVALEAAIALAKRLDKRIRPVGVFVNAPVETVNRFLAEAPNAAAQLHGEEDAAYIASLRQAAGLTIPQSPTIGQNADDEAPSATEANDVRKTSRPSARNARIIQAFRIRNSIDTLKAAASTADLVLLDNGAETGQTFDWRLLTGFPRPFLLAGGLGPENLAQAIEQAGAAAGERFLGVDMSSSLETNGAKDPAKMLAAVQAARERRRWR